MTFSFDNKKYLALIDSAFCRMTESYISRRSLEKVCCVMNVPMAAVLAIAKDSGLDIVEEKNECIGDHAVKVFQDAYIRKLKSYVNHMIRHNHQASIDELLAFNSFCLSYKKKNSLSAIVACWEEIDEDAIRDTFKAKVEENATKRRTTPSLFSGVGFFEFEKPLTCDEIKEIQFRKREENERKWRILMKVNLKYLLHSEPNLNVKPNPQQDDNGRCQMIAAHYYIYTRSDKEDPNEDTVSYSGCHDHMFNSTFRMVS